MRYDLGLVKEGREGEVRTLLRPTEVRHLASGASVCFEAGLGEGIGLPDADYLAAGAELVTSRVAWESRLVAKFKAPTPEQVKRLGRRSTIAAMMHAEGSEELVQSLLQHAHRAVAFEYLTRDGSSFPLMRATGEISGQQAITYAAYFLQRPLKGIGKLFASAAPSPGALTTILGFGNVGRAAARAAEAIGGRVQIVHWSPRTQCSCGYECLSVDDTRVSQLLSRSDVIIGALRISTFDTQEIVTEEIVQSMRPGSVIVDVTAGYGSGYLATSTELTTLENPIREVYGVTHIKIRNFPRATPVESVARVSSVFAPAVGEMLLEPAPRWLKSGVIVEDGRIVHPEVARHFRDLA